MLCLRKLIQKQTFNNFNDMKNFLLLICVCIGLNSCGGGTPKDNSETTQESKVTVPPEVALIDKYFTVDTIQCHVYENTPDYVRIETTDVLSKDAMKRVIDTLGTAIKGNIVYFHIDRIRDRGAEYATYMTTSSYVILADKVVRNQFDFNIQQGLIKLEALNLVTDVEMDNISSILGQLKDLTTVFYDARSNLPPDDPSRKKELSQLEKKIVAERKKYYPLMRKAYYKHIKQVMWVEDVEVKMYGSTIYFYGGIFFSNKNKQDGFAAVYDMVHNLRFKRVCFGPYDGGEYTYWDVYEDGDGAE